MLALVHPFYNGDLFGLIMQACLRVGPRCATMALSTHVFARMRHDMFTDQILALRTLVTLAGLGNFRRDQCYEECVAYISFTRSYSHVREAWVDDGVADAVAKCGRAVLGLPAWLRTSERLVLACLIDGETLGGIAKNMRTDAMLYNACLHGDAIRHIRKRDRTPQLQLLAAQNGASFEHIDMTPANMLAVVKRDGNMLQHVPYRLQTRELCRVAVASKVTAAVHVSERCMTDAIRDMCARAQEPRLLWDVCTIVDADRLITWIRARVACGWDFQRIHEFSVSARKYKIPEHVYVTCLNEKICTLADIPYELRTLDVCLAGYRDDMHGIPWKYRDTVEYVFKKRAN